jgi:DNA helicase INO80
MEDTFGLQLSKPIAVDWHTHSKLDARYASTLVLFSSTAADTRMTELWALLHFIMPSLFDSHDEFNEWFSKDIENAAEKKGQSHMSEYQLRRLHMILKPFMLRRVKRHVQNELSEKIEEDIYVDLSYRQRALYRQVRSNVSIADLLQRASSDAESARSLMNLVMQFRKVSDWDQLFSWIITHSFTGLQSSGAHGTCGCRGAVVFLLVWCIWSLEP